MAGTKQKTSASTEETRGSDFKFCCGNFEKMAQMMRKFCGGKEGTFDCREMMQKLCGSAFEKSGQQ